MVDFHAGKSITGAMKSGKVFSSRSLRFAALSLFNPKHTMDIVLT